LCVIFTKKLIWVLTVFANSRFDSNPNKRVRSRNNAINNSILKQIT